MPKRRKSGGANVSFFAFQDIITAVSGILILIVIFLILMLEQPGLMNVPVEKPNDLTLEELDDLVRKAKEKIREFEILKLDLAGVTDSKLQAEIGEIRESMLKEEPTESKALRNRLEALKTELESVQEKAAELEAEQNRLAGIAEQLRGRINAKADDLAQSKAVKQIWLHPGDTNRNPFVVVVEKDGATISGFKNGERKKKVTPDQFNALLSTADKSSDYFLFFIRPSGVAPFRTMANAALDEGFPISHRALDAETQIHFLTTPGEFAP